MKSRSLRLVVTLVRKVPALLVLFLAASTVQALPFSNGSFEAPNLANVTPDVHGLRYSVFAPGSIIDGGWVVAGPSGQPYPNTAVVGVFSGTYLGATPTAGSQHLAFNFGGTVDGASISQTFDTIAGATYTVQFDVGYASNYASDMSLLAKAYSTGGALLGSAEGKTVGIASHYIKDVTFSFTAVGSSTTLRFSDTPAYTYAADTMLDNVRVSGPTAPVPESGFTFGLLPLALAGLAVLRRKVDHV